MLSPTNEKISKQKERLREAKKIIKKALDRIQKSGFLEDYEITKTNLSKIAICMPLLEAGCMIWLQGEFLGTDWRAGIDSIKMLARKYEQFTGRRYHEQGSKIIMTSWKRPGISLRR